MVQYRVYRKPDGKMYEPILASPNDGYATDWAIRYASESPATVTFSVWEQPFESNPKFNKVRRPAGELVGATHRGRLTKAAVIKDR